MAVDASEQMLAAALQYHLELTGRTVASALPFPADSHVIQKRYQAVVTMATLMHVPDQDIFETVCQIRDQIEPGGVLIASTSMGRESIVDGRDLEGRLFIERSPDECAVLRANLGALGVPKESSLPGRGNASELPEVG